MKWITLLTCAILAMQDKAKPAPVKVSKTVGDTLKKLGRSHFMLGVTSSPEDPWIEQTKAQGCKWDLRYQYLAGGANVKGNWTEWNPDGGFVTNYCRGSEKLGVIPVFTLYQLLQSEPGKGDEAEKNKTNCNTKETMKAYFACVKLFMQRAGEFGRPVILHVEPDLWGYFLQNDQFRPNQLDQIHVLVKSTGHAELASLDDTAAGFAKAFVALRDKLAPNVLLAWHASKWGSPAAKTYADALAKCGKWDLIFTDPSDRDAAWRVAKGYHAEGAWWKDADFTSFRDWGGELHRLTGLPLMAWQIPMGNTIMAGCNNTEGHFMDNRPEYFLENFPANRHVAEYAANGFIGLLFGGGAGGCTSVADVMKDGVTNPPPVQGNKGEKAQFPDDDGGYLRVRGGAYYTKGPVPLSAGK